MWYVPLLAGLLEIVGSITGRVLVALGIGAVTYTGVTTLLGQLKSSAVTALLSLPSEVVGMLATMKVGEGISIIGSAIAARLVLNGLSSGVVKRLVTK